MEQQKKEKEAEEARIMAEKIREEEIKKKQQEILRLQ